jgi:hypothetical protein
VSENDSSVSVSSQVAVQSQSGVALDGTYRPEWTLAALVGADVPEDAVYPGDRRPHGWPPLEKIE